MSEIHSNLTTEQVKEIKSKYMNKYVESGDIWENSGFLSVVTLSFVNLAIKTFNLVGIDEDMIFTLPNHYKCQNEL